MVRKTYVWTAALAVAAGITLTLTYSGLRPGAPDDDPFTLTDGAGNALLLGLLAVAVLAYAMFVDVNSLPLGGTRWRYVFGVPFALLAVLAVVFAVVLPLLRGSY